MADIKNFGIAGVGPEVQFGKRGAKLVQATEAFSFRKNDGAFTTVSVAVPTVDDHAATKGYVDELVGDLDATRIKSTDNLTSVETEGTAGKVTINAAGGSVTKNVATFQSGEDAASSFLFDNATLNRVSFTADGLADDVEMHIAPKGDAYLYLGHADQHAILEAEPGRDLVLSGGSDLDGSGGNLILRAGDGETTEGSILFQTGAGATIMTLEGEDDATGHFVLRNGTSEATLTVSGSAEDVDLVLAPKGAGGLRVEGKNISQVADPVAAQDAATKAYVDVQLSSGAVGSVHARDMTVGVVTADVGNVVKGHIRRVLLKITTAYSAGTSITVGTSAVPDEIVSSDIIDETSVGIYDLNVSHVYAVDTQLRVFINGSPTTGAAVLMVEYIKS